MEAKNEENNPEGSAQSEEETKVDTATDQDNYEILAIDKSHHIYSNRRELVEENIAEYMVTELKEDEDLAKFKEFKRLQERRNTQPAIPIAKIECEENVQISKDRNKSVKQIILQRLVMFVSVMVTIASLLAVTLYVTQEHSPGAPTSSASWHNNSNSRMASKWPEILKSNNHIEPNVSDAPGQKPKYELDINLKKMSKTNPNELNLISALPNGEALVSTYTYHVDRPGGIWKINRTGHFYKQLYTYKGKTIISYKVYSGTLFILHYNRTTAEVEIATGLIQKTYTINIASNLYNYRILYSNSYTAVNPDIWPVFHILKNYILVYNISTRQVEFQANATMRNPKLISYYKYNSMLYSFVPDGADNKIHMFDSNWILVRNIEVEAVYSVVPTASESLLFSQYKHRNVSAINLKGKRLKVVIDIKDPYTIGLVSPYMWIETKNDILRYKINVI